MSQELSFQQRHFPDGECFGCGPGNTAGLRINSYPAEDGAMVCDWTPEPEHGNGGGSVCGGIMSTVLDCHAAAAGWHALMRRDGRPAALFTKEFTVQFLHPTPLETVRLTARVTEMRTRSVAVEAVAEAGGEVCVRFSGVFVVPRETPAS